MLSGVAEDRLLPWGRSESADIAPLNVGGMSRRDILSERLEAGEEGPLAAD